ncbi:hypothetical protein BJX76DRAFT_353303 [Aspergillus varians]
MPPVSPRASKEEFMQALGLSSRNPQHDRTYLSLRETAGYIYTELNASPTNLLDNLASNPSTRTPYFWHHIKPERQRWAMREVVRRAGPDTRELFAAGETDGEYGPNWVSGWLLYSVFRSRDVRNNRNRRKGGAAGGGGGGGGGAGEGGGASKLAKRQAGNDTGQAKKEYYDPVRNG